MDRFDTSDNMRWSARTSPTDGPKRICKFCILGVFLPMLCLCVPLYMRFLAFQPHFFTISPLDMKLLNHESKVSTVWCQGQELRMNGTFNAYLLPRKPRLHRFRHSINMTRRMNLPDDVKEYWGFYLLKGSFVKLSVCSRHEGASFIVVKGLKDARRCSFLGELDSNEEESDEDSDEFEFANDGSRPGAKPSQNVTKENQTKSNQVPSASQELFRGFMSRFQAMEVVEKQLLIKKLLKNMGQDPKSEEQLDDPRILNKFMSTSFFRRKDNKTNDFTSKNRTSFNGDFVTDGDGDVDGAFENFDEVIEERDKGGVTGLTDRGHFGERNPKDKSREETKSSWSSSEEALMRCEGLIHNIALDGDTRCAPKHPMHDLQKSMKVETVQINETGFYYFIFANENEIVDNYLVAIFNLQKTLFDVSEQVMNCTNSTGSCIFPLKFWSEDYVVLEAPEFQPNSSGNSSDSEAMDDNCSKESGVAGFTNVPECHHVMLAESICQPRKQVYVIFILLVPAIILFSANLQ